MAIRQDNSIPVTLLSIDNINNKKSLRDLILQQWILETPNSKYRYFVETLTNKDRIYLVRPGRLNKGCDFVIYIENQIIFKNGNDRPPKQDFIINDLIIKKNNLTQTEWNELLNDIDSIYNCNPFQTANAFCINLPTIGENYDLILKTLRWFFIEQDITYWSGIGRDMLFNRINSI
ncbi:MAG: hypothetical protein IAE65_01835 [Ignavibacteria bacterium]|nr:hypothetical protein [Ignavibacteria bacterium]